MLGGGRAGWVARLVARYRHSGGPEELAACASSVAREARGRTGVALREQAAVDTADDAHLAASTEPRPDVRARARRGVDRGMAACARTGRDRGVARLRRVDPGWDGRRSGAAAGPRVSLGCAA